MPYQFKNPNIQSWLDAGAKVHWPLGECEIYYQDIGDKQAEAAKTLLLVHGFPESSFSFHKVVRGLQAQFERIVLVDFPGYGLSDKPSQLSYSLFNQADALFFVWKHLGIKGGHLLAHDMGDSVATEIIARSVQDLLPGWFSQGIQSLTLTNGNMVISEAQLVTIQKLLLSPLGAYFNRLTNEKLFTNQVKKAHGASLDQSDISDLWELTTLNQGHLIGYKLIGYYRERERFQDQRWLKSLKSFSHPIHVCWGLEDAVAPIGVARYLKQHICPKAVFSELPGVGHFCQLQAPKLWTESVLRFFDEVT